MSGWRARHKRRLTGEWGGMRLLLEKTIAAQEVDQWNRCKAAAELPKKLAAGSSAGRAIYSELAGVEIHERLLLLRIEDAVFNAASLTN